MTATLGLLSQTATLLAPVKTKTGAGGWTTSHQEVGSTRARVVAAKANSRMERIRAAQPSVAQLVEIVCDVSRFELRPEYRVRVAGREYEVVELDVQDSVAFAIGRLV